MSQNLRLTLRTLLAYIDDTLEPAQAKAIGQKVAESESAQELIERIKQVTRRRRLTTPPTTGPGSKIDPNTIADYLDNAVSPEQAAEVEQIALASDVHLAEVAACHQILTLIMGEPVKPPASALQKMYNLVKGPEAIPFRKPAGAKPKAEPDPLAESGEVDETLRLGLPALGRKDGWRNPLLLIGGGLIAAVLLVVAIFNVLSLPGHKEEPKTDGIAQADSRDKTKGDKTDATVKDKDKDSKDDTKPQDKKPDDDKKLTDKKEPDKDKKADDKEPELPKAPMIADAPFGPPSTRQAPIGHYVPDAKEPSILLQASPDAKGDWKRLSLKQSEVLSARPLLSLPASRSVVQTNRGVKVMLWGTLPDFIKYPLYESKVELFGHDAFDLEVRLHRGRVVLTSTRDKPVQIRLRFENPMISSDKEVTAREEHFDIVLQNKGASLLVDRWSNFPLTEQFYKNPKNPNRVGPTALMGCITLSGVVIFKTGDLTFSLSGPPGPSVVVWTSVEGPKGPNPLANIPDFALDNPPPAPGTDPKLRKDMLKARDYVASQLAVGTVGVDVGLAENLYSPDMMRRRLVVLSMAALDDLSGVLEALDQAKVADLRRTANEALRNWIAASRDNDYKLFDLLKEKYKNKEAEIIMEMLHPFSPAELNRPERYELLIDYLVNPNMIIRELGSFHLYNLVPAGKSIGYAADADSRVRAAAEAQWRLLIPPGQLPPRGPAVPMPMKK